MGVYVWCEIVCARCNAHLVGRFTTGALPRRALMKEVKLAGYPINEQNVFCSDKCRVAHAAEVARVK